jgi:hypothetical protein
MNRSLTALVLVLLACGLASPALTGDGEDNPAATGFNHDGSDTEAIEIADEVMEAMGGRRAWDRTRHIRWRFLGRRLHAWDKHTGDIRVEGEERDTGEPYVILMNIHTKKGRAWRSGTEITDFKDLAAMIDHGEALWINDGYWVFMPYKLKDSGVTLAYLGEGTLLDERKADVLELTFQEVGRTPENKYHVFVSRDRHLVEQWSFFAKADDPEPLFTNPWGNWQRYGAILLSDSRGESAHTDLAVFESLPRAVYEDPAPVDWSSFE